MKQRNRLPSPALLVAVAALIAALGGSAIALPGTKTVKENDLANDIVASKHLKPEAVKGSDIHEDSLKSKHIADDQVGAEDLAEPEPYKTVTDFADGGQNDCQWYDGTADTPGGNPVSYYKDPFGIVHLAGTARAKDGPGGDGACDDLGDQVAFTLPPGYQPDNGELQGGLLDEVVMIAPENGLTGGGISAPAGTVIVPFLLTATDEEITLDGMTFRAVDTTNLQRAESPARMPALDRMISAASG